MVADLNLRVLDTDDLVVLSASLQDAVVRREDMGFDKKRRRFALLMNRFCWECAAKDQGKRVRTALHFEGVLDARCKNLQSAEEGVFELLAIFFTPNAEDEDPGGEVTLTFSGDRTLSLKVECLEAVLKDQTDAWQARVRPRHFGVVAR